MSNRFIERYSGLTEAYEFYNGTVHLRYAPDPEHVYYLITPEGELEPQDGVTTVCHIIDKSNALVPWAAKMVVQKLMTLVQATAVSGHVSMSCSDLEHLAMKAKSAPRDKVDEAADIGHMAHDWLEEYIQTVLAEDSQKKHEILARMPDEERARNCCTAALNWMRKHNVRWIKTECKIYSKANKYAGTMDGLAMVDSCDDELCCKDSFKDHLSVVDWKSSNHLYLEYLFQTAAYEQAYEEEHGITIQDRWVLRLGKEDGEFEPWYMPDSTFAICWKGFSLCLSLSRAVKEVEAMMDARKLYIRTRRKEIAKAKAIAAKKIKCGKAAKYKGVRKPRCINGVPCEYCLRIYTQVQEQKIVKNALTPEEINSKLFK